MFTEIKPVRKIRYLYENGKWPDLEKNPYKVAAGVKAIASLYVTI